MELLASYWWVILLGLLGIFFWYFRHGSVRLAAKGATFGVELEGKAAGSKDGPGKPETAGNTTTASGARAVAIGGNASGAMINTGDSKR